MAMSNTMKIALTFTAIDAASGVVLGLEKKILGMGKDAQKVRRDFEDMVGHTRAGLKSLAASKYIFDMIKPAVRIAADTEEAMTSLEMTIAKAGESSAKLHEELEKVRDTCGKLQLLFPFGQREMIQAATVMAQAGMKVQDLYAEKGALFSVGALASLSQGKMSTEGSASLVSTGANIFGVKGNEIGRMADWMQRIGTTTPLHLENQQHSLAEGGAMARLLGISYKDALTAMGVAARQSGDATTAGERFSEFGMRLVGPTKKEKKALKQAGIKFYNEKGHRLPFQDIVKELQNFRKKAEKRGLTEEKIDELFKHIFEGRGQFMATYLSKTGEGSFQDVAKNAEESLSVEEKLAKALQDFNRQVQALTGSIQTLVADAFDPLLKDLTPIVMKINDVVGALDSFTKKNRELTHGISVAVAILGGVLVAGGVYRMVRAVISLGRVLAGLGVAVSGVSTAAGAATTGTLGLVGVLGVLSKYLAPFLFGLKAGQEIKKSEENYADKRAEMKGELSGDKEYYNKFFERMDITREHPVEHERLDEALSNMYEAFKERPKIEITQNIRVDQSGRVTSSSDDPNTTTKINLKRGEFDLGGF